MRRPQSEPKLVLGIDLHRPVAECLRGLAVPALEVERPPHLEPHGRTRRGLVDQLQRAAQPRERIGLPDRRLGPAEQELHRHAQVAARRLRECAAQVADRGLRSAVAEGALGRLDQGLDHPVAPLLLRLQQVGRDSLRGGALGGEHLGGRKPQARALGRRQARQHAVAHDRVCEGEPSVPRQDLGRGELVGRPRGRPQVERRQRGRLPQRKVVADHRGGTDERGRVGAEALELGQDADPLWAPIRARGREPRRQRCRWPRSRQARRPRARGRAGFHGSRRSTPGRDRHRRRG